MQPLIINSFSPQCEITAIADGGIHHVLTPDAVTLTLIRSVDGGAGSFSLTLTANQDARGHSWQDRLHPMDFLEIRVGNKRLPNGKLPIRMRAFVDSVSENFTMPTQGGPQRSVLITGRDYTKLFQSQNIQFLWSQTLSSDGSFPGMSMNFGVPADGKASVTSIVRTILDDVFLGVGSKRDESFLPLYRGATGVKVPDIIPHLTVPDMYMAQYFTINGYTGMFWDLMTYFTSQPLGEMFVYDAEEGPILVFRVAPFKGVNGNIISPAQDPELPTIAVSPAVVTAYDLGRTDQQVLNYFFSMSDAASSNGSSALAYTTKKLDLLTWTPFSGGGTSDNPYWNSRSVKKFGLKPINIGSPWIQLWTQKDGSARQNATVLSNFMGQAFGHNESLIAGQLSVHGNELFIPGRYIRFSDVELYLESVSEVFQFVGSSTPSWTATLNATRGQSITHSNASQDSTPAKPDTFVWTPPPGGHPAP